MFTNYDGKSDPMEHVSHYNQSMDIYSKNEALISKVFFGKFRPRLIELTSFKPKFLIRFFFWINLVKTNQYHINIMHIWKLNKTRYDDPEKPMKQTSFTVKNLGGNLPKKQSTIEKRNFRSSTKTLSLDSIIYRFRTSELFNIWTPPFDARILVRD